MTSAVWLACLSTFLFGPAGPWLARARWPQQAPRAAVVLWQAIGIAGALAAIGFGLSVTVMPAHAGLLGGTTRLVQSSTGWTPAARSRNQRSTRTVSCQRRLLGSGHRLSGNGLCAPRLIERAIAISSISLAGLLMESQMSTFSTIRRVAAYCLPGFRPRIVLSAGVLSLLRDSEIGAVVAHEEGHAHGHHGVVMLPFSSMDSLLRWMPYARHARAEVAVLLEMAADDFAVRSTQTQDSLVH